MAILIGKNSFGYNKMEKEDPEEKRHREAQFLIYKTMKLADQMVKRSSSSRPSWLRVRICKLKVKIGKRLMRLRKTMLSTMVKTKVGVCKHLMGHFKNFKCLFYGGGGGGGGGGCGGSRGGRRCSTTTTTTRGLPQPWFTTSLD